MTGGKTGHGCRRCGAAALAVAIAMAAGAAQAAAPTTPPAPGVAGLPPVAGDTDHLFGIYLAAKQAQGQRDFRTAGAWYAKALAQDPTSPELISRTFLMDITTGDFDRARKLAPEALKIDPSDALPQLVLLVTRLKAGDTAGALQSATALPQDGLHRFVAPLALAWTRAASGDIPGADTALQGLDKFNGFAPLKEFQLGLLYDYANQPANAETHFAKALAASGTLNWRLIDAIARFDERHGHPEKAQALYQKFIKENGGSELAQSVLATRPASTPGPLVRTPADGLAEAMFDLASVLNQAETLDLALIYDRFALELRPQFPLAQLLLADALSTGNKPAESLAVLQTIPQTSPYRWSSDLRAAANLDTLGRTDEAIALLTKISQASPKMAGAELELGDLLRNKKRYTEAVVAYDEAIRRAAASGEQERWAPFYDRGVALERAHQWARAEGDLLHALKLRPNQPLVLNYLGYSWIDRGEHLARGLKMIEKAVELRPDDGYIIDSLGWAHYRMGDYTGAVQYLEKAVELVPEDPTINDHLGDAYWQVGRLTEARYQWRRALQFGPEPKEIKPIEVKLERGLTAAPATPERGG
ncbi:MAG TPA: tetratricopeptide repeat protein [Stellaceae bacterium]|nr:tetratricopeptide repeat protein [Stellaceae bacterium]